MERKKFIIEKEKEIWYTNSDLRNTSDAVLESFIFSQDDVISLLEKDVEVHRIIHLTCESLSPYITDLITVFNEELWEQKDTMGDYIDKVRTFIQSDCVIDVENLIKEDYKSLEKLIDDCVKVVTEKYKKYLSKNA